MPKYQYGCAKVEMGVFDPLTGLSSGWKEVDIYQNTIVVEQPEASRTDHFKQGDPNPKVSRFAPTVKTITQSIMDVSAASKTEHLGGTMTTVDNVDTWNAPKRTVNSKVRSWRYTLEDGSVITVPHTDTSSRSSFNLNDTDIAMIPQTIIVKSTGIESVADFQWADAPED